MSLFKSSPKIYTEKSFLYLVNSKKVTVNKLTQDKGAYYTKVKKIKKDRVSFREIYKPKKELKIVLKKINRKYLSRFMFLPFIHCGPKGRSIVTAARSHNKYNFHLSLDIESFFDRITVPVTTNVLLQKGVHKNIVKIITNLCCEDNKLPQGFPTSSLLSALVLDSIFSDFYKKFNKREIMISIYADDILLSSNDTGFLEEAETYIKEILVTVGLTLNDLKRDLGRKGSKFYWLGLQLHPWISFSRKYLTNLQREVYRFKTEGILPEGFKPKKPKKTSLLKQWEEATLGRIVFIKSIQSNKLVNKIERDLKINQELPIIPPSSKTAN